MLVSSGTTGPDFGRSGFPFRGVSYSRTLLSAYIHDGVLDLTKLFDLLPTDLAANLCQLGQGPRDVPMWWVATDGMFSFTSAKSFLRSPGPKSEALLRRCWHKHLPFKVSFLAWRVLRGWLPVANALARFVFHVVSCCWCCEDLA